MHKSKNLTNAITELQWGHSIRVVLRSILAAVHEFRTILKRNAIVHSRGRGKSLAPPDRTTARCEILFQALGGEDRAKAALEIRVAIWNAMTAQKACGFATRPHTILRGKEWRPKEQTARE
jgi:hypothetical protein